MGPIPRYNLDTFSKSIEHLNDTYCLSQALLARDLLR